MASLNSCLGLGAAILILGFAGAAAAAEAGATPPPQAAKPAAKQVFTAADFARFAPKTAYDMLVQVPGFVIRQADSERGLGQASENVLIDGKRVTNKSGGAIADLQKLPAASVDRIEVVDAATLDIAGLAGQVANVVTRANKKNGGRFSFIPEFRSRWSDPMFSRGDISYSGVAGPVQYTVGLENYPNRAAAGGPTTIFDPTGTVTEIRQDKWHFNRDAPRVSLRLTLDGPGSSVGHFNSFYSRYWNRYYEDGRRDVVVGLDYLNLIRNQNDGSLWEVGGDYEFKLGPGRLKLVGLMNGQDDPYQSTLTQDFSGAAPMFGVRFFRHARTHEEIGRAEYSLQLGKSSLQLSGEAAFNDLKTVAELGFLNPAGAFDMAAFPSGTGGVHEDRYEGLVTFGRPLGSSLNLQLVFGAEESTLASEQAGLRLERRFFRPKGSLSLAWKAAKDLDISLKLRRRVGQLNFYDFLASVNLTSNQQNAGNLELVPPQSWEAELEASRNLGRWGTTRLRVFAHRIDDLVDTIPIGPTGQSPGNIDRASRYGFEWTSTFKLDPMGLPGAKLDTNVFYEWSRVRDPLTGAPRPISQDFDRHVGFSFRQDFPRSPWAWGTALDYYHNALDYRLTEVGTEHEGPVWMNAYIENKDVWGLTVQAKVGDILGAGSFLERTVYVGRRTGPELFEERRRRRIGPIFTFSVKGSF